MHLGHRAEESEHFAGESFCSSLSRLHCLALYVLISHVILMRQRYLASEHFDLGDPFSAELHRLWPRCVWMVDRLERLDWQIPVVVLGLHMLNFARIFSTDSKNFDRTPM